MKKRILSLILALIMLLSVSACGGKGSDTETVTVTFPEVSAEREVAERAGAFAVDQYVYARMKTEALIEYDLENGSPKELSVMVNETLKAWRVAEAAANGAEQIASVSENLTMSPIAATMSYAYSEETFNPFVMTAYAAEENAATRWAKEITEKFDSYPANARIKTLAQELGVDAKNAYKQLQMAQDILKGDAERQEGDLNALVENTLIATRTVCKTTLYVTGTVASAGTASALEIGCMVVGGVDTVVDIATTGCTIIRGENDSVTLTLSEVKDYLAPVSAVAGGIGFFTSGIGNLEKFSDKMGLLDKFTYVGDSLLDYYQDDKVLGIQIGTKDNAQNMTITEIDANNKGVEEVAKELEKAGLPSSVPTEAKPADEVVSKIETEMGGVWTVDAVQDFLDELMPEDSKPNDEPATGDASVDTVETYTMTTVKEDGLTDSFPAEVRLHKDGTMEITFTPHQVVVNDDFTFSVDQNAWGITEHLVGKYEAETNTFTGMGNTENQDDAWNWATTVLTFDAQLRNASGILGEELEDLAAASFKTQITLEKKS